MAAKKNEEGRMKDLISRKAVLGLAKDLCIPGKDGVYKHRSIDPIDVMELPSVNTEQDDMFEYHYDHTDCIWYHDGKGRCPSTCSQYRDGWNDAMMYIFKGGPGYRPYRRNQRYEE